MAVFGTLEEEVDAEYRATMAGLEFQKAIVDMNKERGRSGLEPISIGVGINTGIYPLNGRKFTGGVHWLLPAARVYGDWRYGKHRLANLQSCWIRQNVHFRIVLQSDKRSDPVCSCWVAEFKGKRRGSYGLRSFSWPLNYLNATYCNFKKPIRPDFIFRLSICCFS